jgi:hypothetical protein
LEYSGYSEEDLVSNRAALLLYGGTEHERRAWAHEAGGNFASEGALVEIHSAQQLESKLAQSKGVIFVPDALGLGIEAQRQIVRCLQEQEERPKIIIGLSKLPDEAIQQGLLRDDLSYRLRVSRVNLDLPGLAEAIETRRRKLQDKLAAVKDLVDSKPATRDARSKASVKSKAAPINRSTVRKGKTGGKRSLGGERTHSKQGKGAAKRTGSKGPPTRDKGH